MKVIFAAARRVPLAMIGEHLVHQLAGLPMEATVVLRAARNGQPQAFERLAAELCESLSVPVEWAKPNGRGREATFNRDVTMVREADRLVIYVHDDYANEASGTWHVIERAISEDKEASAYTVTTWADLTVLRWFGGS